MEDTFELPVSYKGEVLMFPLEVVRYGYVHRIRVAVNGQVVYLEKDEEGNYRAIADESNSMDPDKDLVAAIISSVEALLK